MPVTLKVVDHAAEPWRAERVTTTESLLEEASPKQYRRTERVLQSSFTRRVLRDDHTSASKNGFVWAAIRAYSSHHHLTIRPEDVWFAILTQVGFYINANAESLRAFFVEHEGQKELEVIDHGTLDSANFGAFAEQMTHMIAKNVKDPELRDWVMPSFTTTTESDVAVASVLFMGAMQKYFKYTFTVCCGIPSVTVLGEIEDWETMLARLDKLEQLGEEPKQFADMLRPILNNIILSFTEPSSPVVQKFWNSVADEQSGSGFHIYSGWIAAFCFWDVEGKAQLGRRSRGDEPCLAIDSSDIPVGFCSVPVTVNDNGDIINCTMIAGSVGIQARQMDVSSEVQEDSQDASDDGQLNAIQPLSGWWICENESAEVLETRANEMESIKKELIPLDEAHNREWEAYMKCEDRRNFKFTNDHRREELQSRLRVLQSF